MCVSTEMRRKKWLSVLGWGAVREVHRDGKGKVGLWWEGIGKGGNNQVL